MKKLTNSILVKTATSFLSNCCSSVNSANILESGLNVFKAISVFDEELIEVSIQLREQQDKQNKIAPENSAYAKRLNRLMAKLQSVNGIPLNYKVYKGNERKRHA